MPKIAATSIEEHVRQQTERITAAARKLFASNGYGATDMGQIAAAVGLARNSLYRYYPNKDHILLACIQEDMRPYLEQLATLADEYPDPRQRISRWVAMQFELATGPSHATMELMNEVREASPTLKKDVLRLHEEPNTVLGQALRECRLEDRDTATLAAMIGGMVLSATSHALSRKRSECERIAGELQRAVSCLINK
jgi:AcrR family transcriptional regulator